VRLHREAIVVHAGGGRLSTANINLVRAEVAEDIEGDPQVATRRDFDRTEIKQPPPITARVKVIRDGRYRLSTERRRLGGIYRAHLIRAGVSQVVVVHEHRVSAEARRQITERGHRGGKIVLSSPRSARRD